MAGTSSIPFEPFVRAVTISSPPEAVWQALTMPGIMKKWMSETEIEILTTWEVGSPFTIKGDWYKTGFENKGQVIHYEPYKELQYTHLSSLSRLPDAAESYTSIGFRLEHNDENTTLTVVVSNFPTETIYRHMAFYWGVAIMQLKKLVESATI
jgi:uncharacterized protein YndB with AHSA1/START domain